MRNINTPEEIVDLVDSLGRITGREFRRIVHGNPSMLHPVVHVHIINSRHELLLQKRSESKDVQPGKWDTAVGGHIISGESVDAAMNAEIREELGIAPQKPELLFTYIHRNAYESEFVYVHLMKHDGPFFPSPDEVAEIRFWPLAELEPCLGDENFTPNFTEEYPRIKPFLGTEVLNRGSR